MADGDTPNISLDATHAPRPDPLATPPQGAAGGHGASEIVCCVDLYFDPDCDAFV